MITISHWGMFNDSRPFMVPAGFKLSEADMAEWNKPGGIIEIVPLAKGEPQPIYRAPGWDCA